MDMTLRKWKFCKFFCNFGGTIMDSLGDRVKSFEIFPETYLDIKHPILARIDGRAFHMFSQEK